MIIYLSSINKVAELVTLIPYTKYKLNLNNTTKDKVIWVLIDYANPEVWTETIDKQIIESQFQISLFAWKELLEILSSKILNEDSPCSKVLLYVEVYKKVKALLPKLSKQNFNRYDFVLDCIKIEEFGLDNFQQHLSDLESFINQDT